MRPGRHPARAFSVLPGGEEISLVLSLSLHARLYRRLSQCSPLSTARFDPLSLAGWQANSCANDLPSTCSGDCSSVFLDFADSCQSLITSNPATAASFSAFAAQCRAGFGVCHADTDCGTNAVCLNMLGCTVPPCSRCICQQGYEGDGHTCTVAAPPPPPPAPEILGSRTQPTPILPGAEVHGAIAGRGQPGFYSLTVTTGVAYTITVTLGSLDDSVLEVC